MEDTSFQYSGKVPQEEDSQDLGLDPRDVEGLVDEESGRYLFGPDCEDESMQVEHDSADTMVAMMKHELFAARRHAYIHMPPPHELLETENLRTAFTTGTTRDIKPRNFW